MSNQRKQPSTQVGPGSAALVNSINPAIIQRIVERELNLYSIYHEGCIVSTRCVSKGQYPRVNVKKYLTGEYRGLPASLCRVSVNHLVLTLNGQQVPQYTTNDDVMHSCHKGKARFRTDKCCITPQHLSIGSHGDNMRQQNCVPITRCSYCELLIRTCCHMPQCISQLTNAEAQQHLPSRIKLYYNNGLTRRVYLQ
jgi:hypothetical protein